MFMCKSKHSLCLECFAQYCKVMLGSDKFSSFECGYSVCCPGPGKREEEKVERGGGVSHVFFAITDESCVCSPVEDPHHFQMVDKDGTFVSNINMCVHSSPIHPHIITCTPTPHIYTHTSSHVHPHLITYTPTHHPYTYTHTSSLYVQ